MPVKAAQSDAQGVVPNPPDHRKDRRRYDQLRAQLAEVRERYTRFCYAKLRKASRANKTAGVIAMQEKMQERGLYSKATFCRDIRWSILRKFWWIERRLRDTKISIAAFGWRASVEAIGFDTATILDEPRNRRRATA